MLDTSLTSSNFYFLLAVFQGLLLSAIIIFQNQRSKPNTYLGLLLFLFSSALLHSVLESSIHAFNTKFPVPMEFSFCYGPLAYLHILHIKDPTRKFGRKDLLHFIPTFLIDIILFTTAALYLGANMDWVYDHIPLIQSVALYIAVLGIVQLAIYTYLIYKESVDTKLVLKEFQGVKKWLSILMYSWGLIILFLMVAIPIGLLFIEQLDDNSEWIYKPLGAIMAIWIFVLGYSYVLKYAKVVGHYMEKIRKFSFKVDEIEEKKEQLVKVLNEERLYQDPRLTVAKLAGHLGWPINSLSTIINDALQTNFNDMVNRYRIMAFKELTDSPESKKYSILGLGQEVGFSSKASFYRVFKKEMGMTPSEFMQKQA